MSARLKSRMDDEKLVIYEKWGDCAKDAYNLLRKFPSEERFVLCAQIREVVMDIGNLILDINEERMPEQKLRMAARLDSRIRRVRALFKVALKFGYISQKNYLVICEKWIEIGRILGGWKKCFQPRRY